MGNGLSVFGVQSISFNRPSGLSIFVVQCPFRVPTLAEVLAIATHADTTLSNV
jgi:hypothetical protein